MSAARVRQSSFVSRSSTTTRTGNFCVWENPAGKRSRTVPLTSVLDNTYQISIWSNVEAGLGITAGCLTTLRPLVRFLRDSSSASRSRNPGSFPLSSNVAPGLRPSRSKHRDREDVHQLWTGSELDDYHEVTTTIMGSQRPNPTSSSEEDLNPNNNSNDTPGWKVERSVPVSVRNE
jgi:hypothetical protein